MGVGAHAGERARKGLQKALPLSSPKDRASEAAKVLMGELRPRLPEPTQVNLKLEAALEQWKKAAEGQSLFGSGQ